MTDKDHIFINGKQYVSLKRFAENRIEIAAEMKMLAEENEKLANENEHLKALIAVAYEPQTERSRR